MRKILTFSVLCFLLLGAMRPGYAPKTKVVIGYVGGYRGRVDITKIQATKLTHINYAFVNIKNNKAFLAKEETDTLNLRNLVKLKSDNPGLKILISIGGWSWSENFSNAALSDSSRKAFAESTVDIVRKYNLDGVDIDWEYPGIPGEQGNVYRPEDKQNFTLMLKEIRLALDGLAKSGHSRKLLTIAVGGFSDFIRHTEMDLAQQYLDFVNLMTYDFYHAKVAGHHTNLYDSKTYPAENYVDKTFREFVKSGVPAKKLVMGIAFYSRSFTLSQFAKKGLGDSILTSQYGKGYTFIKDSLANKNGYLRLFDQHAKAPYLFNPLTHEFMSYDDEQSVAEKCRYVNKNDMAGVMFWEYDADLKGYLLSQINKSLK